MIPCVCLLVLSLVAQAKPPMLTNGGFQEGLKGWQAEGQVTPGEKSVTLGPGKAVIHQRYEVPGLRILFFGAGIKPSAKDVAAKVRVQCFDSKDRLLMDLVGGPDKTDKGGVYLKTQAHTAYVLLSVENDSEAGTVVVTDATLQDDDKNRVEHSPQVDLDAVMKPIWKAKTVLNESVLLLSRAGSAPSGRLMFKPTKVLSLKDSSLRTEFVEGKDFTVDGDTIKALKGSKIPVMSDTDFAKGEFPWTPLDGHHVFVTYRHSDTWRGPKPVYQGSLLPETTHKLAEKKPVTIVAYGDSITLGVNVSGFRNVPPFQPPWPSLFAYEIGRMSKNAHVKLYNTGLGGMTSQWAKDNAKDAVAALEPDLVIIAFGMNDFWSLTPAEFRSNIEATMATIRAHCPKCEFVLVASMRFDPAYTTDPTYVGNFEGYADQLRKMTGPGVALLDMTAISEALYTAKSQRDLGTDPMHPDDFLARWYAQGMVATLVRQ